MQFNEIIELCLKEKLFFTEPFRIIANKNGGQSITFKISDANGNLKWMVKFFDYLKDIRSYFQTNLIDNYNSLYDFLENIENAGDFPYNIEDIIDYVELQKRCFDRYIQVSKIKDLCCFPQIVYFDDEVKIDDSFYGLLIEEFVIGETLEQKMKSPIENKATFTFDFLFQLGNLLEKLSLHGIIHRDISPDNIIISDNTYLLIDPGVVKLDDGAFTKSHMILGKRCYASPEQYFGNAKRATFGSDLYAVGIIALEIILGYNPLFKIISEGDTASPHKELIRRYDREIEDDIFRSIEENDFTSRLVLIIKKLIQIEERNRFDSVNSFILALNTVERMVDTNE